MERERVKVRVGTSQRVAREKTLYYPTTTVMLIGLI